MIESIARLWAQGKSLSSIGEALGVSRGQIAGIIDRARKKAIHTRFGRRPVAWGVRLQVPFF